MSKHRSKVGAIIMPELIKAPPQHGAMVRGIWRIEHWRDGRCIQKQQMHNIVTNEGLDHYLDSTLSAATQITAWYAVAYTDATTFAPVAGSTYANQGSGTELTTQVAEANRQQWSDGGVSGQSVDNSASPAAYTANTSVTVTGGALVGGGTAATTKNDSAGGGTMMCGGTFGSSIALVNNDVLKLTITLTMADDGV